MQTQEFLTLPRSASPDQVRRAYRRLALRYHPDCGGDPEVFVQLYQEYQQKLEESELRLECDEQQLRCLYYTTEPDDEPAIEPEADHVEPATQQETIRPLVLSRLPNFREPTATEKIVEVVKGWMAKGESGNSATFILTLLCALTVALQATPSQVGFGVYFACLGLLVSPAILGLLVSNSTFEAGRSLYCGVIVAITACMCFVHPSLLFG